VQCKLKKDELKNANFKSILWFTSISGQPTRMEMNDMRIMPKTFIKYFNVS
jgi:hypothetical protein